MTPQSKRVFAQFFGAFFTGTLLVITANLALIGKSQFNHDLKDQVAYRLMEGYGCFSCHKLAGRGSQVGPALDQIGLKRDELWLRQWVHRPQDIKPDTRMPNFNMPDEHAEQIAKFLKSLQRKAYERPNNP